MPRRRTGILLAIAVSGALGFAASNLSSAKHETSTSGRTKVPWVVPGYQGMPFGDLSVAGDGSLYFLDLEYGQIDELTPDGPRIVLSSLSGGTSPNQSIPALSGLFVTAHNLWFTAQGSIYEATLSGRHLLSVGSAVGALNLDVLNGGTTIFYSTNQGVFEEGVEGPAREVAGGGRLGPGEWTNGGPATEAAESAGSLVAISPTSFDFTTGDNLLAIVRNGSMWEYRGAVDFFNGEMTQSTSARIYAICGWSMCRIDGSSYSPIFRIATHAEGDFVAPTSLAVAPNGDFYEAFTNQTVPQKTGILEMSPSGRLIAVVVSRNQRVRD